MSLMLEPARPPGELQSPRGVRRERGQRDESEGGESPEPKRPHIDDGVKEMDEDVFEGFDEERLLKRGSQVQELLVRSPSFDGDSGGKEDACEQGVRRITYQLDTGTNPCHGSPASLSASQARVPLQLPLQPSSPPYSLSSQPSASPYYRGRTSREYSNHRMGMSFRLSEPSRSQVNTGTRSYHRSPASLASSQARSPLRSPLRSLNGLNSQPSASPYGRKEASQHNPNHRTMSSTPSQPSPDQLASSLRRGQHSARGSSSKGQTERRSESEAGEWKLRPPRHQDESHQQPQGETARGTHGFLLLLTTALLALLTFTSLVRRAHLSFDVTSFIDRWTSIAESSVDIQGARFVGPDSPLWSKWVIDEDALAAVIAAASHGSDEHAVADAAASCPPLLADDAQTDDAIAAAAAALPPVPADGTQTDDHVAAARAADAHDGNGGPNAAGPVAAETRVKPDDVDGEDSINGGEEVRSLRPVAGRTGPSNLTVRSDSATSRAVSDDATRVAEPHSSATVTVERSVSGLIRSLSGGSGFDGATLEQEDGVNGEAGPLFRPHRQHRLQQKMTLSSRLLRPSISAPLSPRMPPLSVHGQPVGGPEVASTEASSALPQDRTTSSESEVDAHAQVTKGNGVGPTAVNTAATEQAEAPTIPIETNGHTTGATSAQSNVLQPPTDLDAAATVALPRPVPPADSTDTHEAEASNGFAHPAETETTTPPASSPHAQRSSTQTARLSDNFPLKQVLIALTACIAALMILNALRPRRHALYIRPPTSTHLLDPLPPRIHHGYCRSSGLCPLTGQPFREPVRLCDGYTYERAAIQLRISAAARNGTKFRSPMTGQEIPGDYVYADFRELWQQATCRSTP